MKTFAGVNEIQGGIAKGLLLTCALLVALCGTAFAQPGHGRMYGKGNPFNVEDLPDSHLKSQLMRLPPQALERAMHHFEDFEFPEADVESLRVDGEGGVFYEDPKHGNVKDSAALSFADTTPAIGESLIALDARNVFALHSKPGATRTVYLNMAGQVVTGTIWNSSAGVDPLYMLPYSQDSNYDDLTQAEVNAIAEVWKRVAEDYAPYDVDITTEKPASFGPQVGHILVTRKADANNNEIYTCSCGGVAYVGVWGGSNYPYYQPALIFTDGVGTGPHNIAEAASHELGHNLSLSHDGNVSSSYYTGHGTGNTDWAPIMGAGYYGQVTQWSKGEYAGANNTQDDLQLIANRLSYRSDDHADSNFQQASPLVVTNLTQVLSTTPVTDRDNLSSANKGIIEDRSDVDLFSVEVGAGTIDLTVEPVWRDVFVTQSYRGANLDISAKLYDNSGALLAESDVANDTYARITVDVGPGRYILAIDGVGYGTPPTSGYTDYASLGQYFISGTVPPAAADDTPPSPNPMTWASVPAAVNSSSIVMTATTAIDERGGTVQYRFDCVNGGAGCNSSNWQDSPTYTATGLTPGSSYSFQVTARDVAGNQTAPSTEGSAMTGPPNQAPSADFAAVPSALTVNFTDTSSDSDGSVVSWAWNFGDNATSTQRNPTHTFASAGTYSVTLTVTDNEGASDTATKPVTVTATTIHVGSLADASSAPGRRSWTAAVVITAHEADHSPAAGVTVTGDWSAGATGSSSCTTDTAGQCTVSKGNIKSSTSSVNFLVTGVSRSGSVAAANDVSTITVKPSVPNSAPSANFTFSVSLLVVTFTDASSDSDGSVVAWAWNFGDGTISTQRSPSHTYASDGSYTVTLAVTDDKGATATTSQNVVVAATQSYHHVAALVGASSPAKRSWTANVTIAVRDANGQPLSGAIVNGAWSGGTSGGASCTTASNGQCSVTKSNLKTNVASVTFTVNEVSKSGSLYDSASNEQNSVVVNKP